MLAEGSAFRPDRVAVIRGGCIARDYGSEFPAAVSLAEIAAAGVIGAPVGGISPRFRGRSSCGKRIGTRASGFDRRRPWPKLHDLRIFRSKPPATFREQIGFDAGGTPERRAKTRRMMSRPNPTNSR
jgi:hypothetical protein